jgi:hypothetical protein
MFLQSIDQKRVVAWIRFRVIASVKFERKNGILSSVIQTENNEKITAELPRLLRRSPDHPPSIRSPSFLLTRPYLLARMAHPSSLPLIDLSPYLQGGPPAFPPTDAQKACSAAIHDACVEFGFFYLTGLGITREEMDSVVALAREFFALPDEEKERISIANQDMARGTALSFLIFRNN